MATTFPIFSFKDCKFANEKEKETTARIVLFKEFGILNSYTLESTFHGSDLFKKPHKDFRKTAHKAEVSQQFKSTLDRYGMSLEGGREDNSINERDLIEAGKDFIRGIHGAF